MNNRKDPPINEGSTRLEPQAVTNSIPDVGLSCPDCDFTTRWAEIMSAHTQFHLSKNPAISNGAGTPIIPQKAQRIAGYMQLLDEMPEKMAKRYNSRDIAVNSTGWEVGELDAYDTAIDDCRAIILKKIEELQ